MKKNSKKLTISCLCSVYRNSVLKEVKMAIESILNGSETPDEIIVVIDGLIDNNLKRYLLSLEESKKIKTLISRIIQNLLIIKRLFSHFIVF